MTIKMSVKQNSYIVALGDLSQQDSGKAGFKAASLGELKRANYPVPDGFVLTIDAFDLFLSTHKFDQSAAADTVIDALLPEDVVVALSNAAVTFDDAPLAVRSSGVAEDLPGASFAGQYETVLNVRGIDALLEAVRKCWASVFNPRVKAYQGVKGQTGVPRMAVLVQKLVSADAAGVAFTANPVTGDRSETVVSAVRGLGERLVSGQVTPDEWVVKDGNATCQSAPEGAINANQARAVAELARRVESYYRVPQDIEWAITDGKLYLLQARPITTLPDETLAPIPVAAEPPPGFWQREVSHSPQAISPMLRSVLFEPRNTAMKRAFGEFSLLVDGIEFQDIGGWEYMRLVPMGGKDRRPPPAWLMPILARIVPSMRSRIKGCIEAIRYDKAGRFIRLWYDDWKPAQIAHIAELRDIDLASLSDSALEEHISTVLSFFRESVMYHFLLQPVVNLKLAELAFACRDVLSWDTDRFTELLNGLSERSSEPARRLAELASVAARKPHIRALLEDINDGTVSRLAELDAEFAAAFSAYQHEFGCRALQYTFHDPTLVETPTLILKLIRDQLSRGFNPTAIGTDLDQKRTAAVAEAHALIAGRSAAEKERFQSALAGAKLAYPVREDQEFYTISAPVALVRYTLLEVAVRLTERKQMADRDDVFFLELEEARTALLKGGDLRDLVARRKAERTWVEAHPGPASYGKDPGAPPSFAGLPGEVRFAMEGLLWVIDHIFASELSAQRQTGESGLRGIPVSPGRYTGSVRVIMNENEFSKLQAGDVLVCPITSPVWSVLFPSVGALITDTGGTLSHPAIIAREYRVPAVVATGNATSLLSDGQIVTVDGTTGRVELVS
jgi:phosphohistidine swiveling domain-containing protein